MALAERLDAPVCCGYQHNDAFPGSHPLFVGPLGYNGSKAAMELISKADVVLALGTRLNPFSTLPGYGIDYWPKDAKIIQVDINPDRIGLTKKVIGGHLRRCQEGGARDPRAIVVHRGRCRPRRAQGDDPQTKSAWAAAAVSRWITRTTIPGTGPGTTAPASATPNLDVAAPGMARHPGRAAQGGDHLVGHRQQLRHRQRLSDLRGGAQIPGAGLFGPCGYGSRRSSAPRSAAPTCRSSALPATAPSASR
jgi:sulfoacetaldehyde acetyltransferase